MKTNAFITLTTKIINCKNHRKTIISNIKKLILEFTKYWNKNCFKQSIKIIIYFKALFSKFEWTLIYVYSNGTNNIGKYTYGTPSSNVQGVAPSNIGVTIITYRGNLIALSRYHPYPSLVSRFNPTCRSNVLAYITSLIQPDYH